MGYIKKIQVVATISLSDITPKISIEVAKDMKKEIVVFLEQNPDGKLELDFGSHVRFSKEFAHELFQGEYIKNNIERIVFQKVHVFDQIMISRELE